MNNKAKEAILLLKAMSQEYAALSKEHAAESDHDKRWDLFSRKMAMAGTIAIELPDLLTAIEAGCTEGGGNE